METAPENGKNKAISRSNRHLHELRRTNTRQSQVQTTRYRNGRLLLGNTHANTSSTNVVRHPAPSTKRNLRRTTRSIRQKRRTPGRRIRENPGKRHPSKKRHRARRQKRRHWKRNRQTPGRQRKIHQTPQKTLHANRKTQRRRKHAQHIRHHADDIERRAQSRRHRNSSRRRNRAHL